MSTTTVSRPATPESRQRADRTSLVRRVFGVVAQPGSYRNIGYLLLGLPLGTIWFTALVTGASVGVSMLVVALLGIPILLGLWYAIRAFANVERGVANTLLGSDIPFAPMASGDRGNLWVRLRSMSGDRARWREAGYLMLRFPVGIATFTAAVTALTTPFMVAYAPFHARYDDQPFGDWSGSSRMEDIASSPWAWFLVPLGLAMLIAAFHLLNALAHACRRWTTSWLDLDEG